jgi:hypothetical protein
MSKRDIEVAPSEPIEPGQGNTKRPVGGLAERLAALADLAYPDLRGEWRKVYRAHPPKKIGRDVLELGIAWKLQEKALGGTSAATKRRFADLAEAMEDKGDLTRSRVAKLKPGAKLVREWRGETHDVLVIENGFLWQGRPWRSLSLIDREITGTRWSGPRFFGLMGKREKEKAVAAIKTAREAEAPANA